MKTSKNTVLVTGGSSGIGLALAKRFISEENLVIITGRNAKKLEDAANETPGLHTIVADMRDSGHVQRLAKEAQHCNILINNAAIQMNYVLHKNKNHLEATRDEIETNFTAPIQLTSLLLPSLMKKKEAAIINVSSALALYPKENAPIYCATKAALHSFTQALRYQLEHTNIKVFEIMPALVDTPMTAGRGRGKISPDTLVDEFWKNFQKGRFFSPIEKVKLLMMVGRISPSIAKRLMRGK